MGRTVKIPAVDHPGVFLREELEERGWTQRDLAYILGRPEQAVNLIISGKRGISADMAKALGEAFDVPAEFFVNLQKMHDLSSAEEPDPGIARRARFFQSSYPIREMVKRGWLEDAEPELLEAQMMRFFEVESVDEIPHLRHAAKKSSYNTIPTNQLAWLFRVRQMAKSIASPRYSQRKLVSALPKLHALAYAPEEVRHVPKIMMDCGIRLVIVQTLPQSKIDGVCFWINKKASPVIGLSLRYDRIDNFWFVLRHEIEHVLRKHGMEDEVIDTELEGENASPEGPVSEEEKIANAAAAAFCSPPEKLDSFIARKHPYISEKDLLGFARTLQVHPGLVVGQLHNRTKDFRYFRKHLVKIRDYLLPSALSDGWGDVAPVIL